MKRPKKKSVTQTSSIAAIGKAMKKAERDRIMEGVPRPEFTPLKSYPAVPHPRQAEVDDLHDGRLRMDP